MNDLEPDATLTVRVMNWISLLVASITGLYIVLAGYSASLGSITIAMSGALGFIGGYLGTWLLLIAAYLLFWIAAGIAFGLIIVLSLLFVIAVFATLLS
ncbi:hypothetical protein [Marinobacter sp.]|uniref:hypothetical protein n=1 Tax=Marinobacter sp. TaxID=50741 RepID=UPI003A8FE8D8